MRAPIMSVTDIDDPNILTDNEMENIIDLSLNGQIQYQWYLKNGKNIRFLQKNISSIEIRNTLRKK